MPREEAQPALVHGKFCKTNDPVSPINAEVQGGGRECVGTGLQSEEPTPVGS